MARALCRALLAGGVVATVAAGGGAAVAGGTPALTADGPVSVAGTEASGVFTLADRTVRQIASARLSPGESEEVTLSMRMNGCESLSSRSGTFVNAVVVGTEQAGLFEDTVTIALPEEIHTGSPREAFCPRSTATSRPQG